MMLFTVPALETRRLVSIALILGLLMPISAGVSRAEDEPPSSQPGTMTPSSPAPCRQPPNSRDAQTAAPATQADGDETGEEEQPAAPVTALTACKRPQRVTQTAWQIEGDDALNSMRATIADTLQRVEVHEQGLTGEVPGFRAGAHYSHIYARDSSTIAPTAQFSTSFRS